MTQDRPMRVRFVEPLIESAELAALLLGIAALAVLAVRAVLRIETRWDAFYYHIPFAAKRAGIPIPFEMSPFIHDLYQGAPPLPEFLQGLLWRITGSLNATGVINMLGLLVFLCYCHRVLRAQVSVVAILCLTVPLVIIHAATNYVDLFGNCMLAIGVTSLIAMMLFDRWRDRALLCWGLAGLVAAAWTKMILLPTVLACLVCYLIAYFWRRHGRSVSFVVLVAGAALLCLIPCAKNEILYGNPIWPIRVPVWSDHFPYTFDARPIHALESPQELLNLSQPALFVHSVFEIGHPTEYAARERWNIDQGNAWIAFRSGGFWNIGVVTVASVAILLGFLFNARKGRMLLAAMTGMWCFVAVLPQSHELRYYLFLPLTTAAVIGMLLPQIRARWPELMLAILAVLLAEFSWMTSVNRDYYRVERAGYQAAANFWQISRFWPKLQAGETYCAVGFEPAAFLLTGPTMREFHIIDRRDRSQCPPGIAVLEAPR